MFTLSSDPVEALAVGLMSGRTNSDEDYEAYCRSIRELDVWAVGRDAPAYVLVVDPGNPPPDARWRKRIAEASAELTCVKSGARPLFVLVTASVAIRGIVTAISWLRPSQYDVVTCATIEDAVRTLAARRGRPTQSLHDLLARARAATTRATRAPRAS